MTREIFSVAKRNEGRKIEIEMKRPRLNFFNVIR